MTDNRDKTRALFEQLGASETRRRLTADRIFRALRHADRLEGPDAGTLAHLPKLSTTLR